MAARLRAREHAAASGRGEEDDGELQCWAGSVAGWAGRPAGWAAQVSLPLSFLFSVFI